MVYNEYIKGIWYIKGGSFMNGYEAFKRILEIDNELLKLGEKLQKAKRDSEIATINAAMDKLDLEFIELKNKLIKLQLPL